MAELVKKLNIKKNSETTPCSIYTTTDEAGQNNLKLTVDDISAFVVLGEDLVNASSGRIQNAGVTYNIKTQAKPPYNKVEYRTPGTFTFTVPTGITTLRIEVAGAGGGGLNALDRVKANGGNGDLKTITINMSAKNTLTVKVGAGGTFMNIDNLSENGFAGGASSVTYNNTAYTAEGGGGAYVVGITLVHNGANAGNGQGGKGSTGDSKAPGANGWVIIEYGGDI